MTSSTEILRQIEARHDAASTQWSFDCQGGDFTESGFIQPVIILCEMNPVPHKQMTGEVVKRFNNVLGFGTATQRRARLVVFDLIQHAKHLRFFRCQKADTRIEVASLFNTHFGQMFCICHQFKISSLQPAVQVRLAGEVIDQLQPANQHHKHTDHADNIRLPRKQRNQSGTARQQNQQVKKPVNPLIPSLSGLVIKPVTQGHVSIFKLQIRTHFISYPPFLPPPGFDGVLPWPLLGVFASGVGRDFPGREGIGAGLGVDFGGVTPPFGLFMRLVPFKLERVDIRTTVRENRGALILLHILRTLKVITRIFPRSLPRSGLPGVWPIGDFFLPHAIGPFRSAP